MANISSSYMPLSLKSWKSFLADGWVPFSLRLTLFFQVCISLWVLGLGTAIGHQEQYLHWHLQHLLGIWGNPQVWTWSHRVTCSILIHLFAFFFSLNGHLVSSYSVLVARTAALKETGTCSSAALGLVVRWAGMWIAAGPGVTDTHSERPIERTLVGEWSAFHLILEAETSLVMLEPVLKETKALGRWSRTDELRVNRPSSNRKAGGLTSGWNSWGSLKGSRAVVVLDCRIWYLAERGEQGRLNDFQHLNRCHLPWQGEGADYPVWAELGLGSREKNPWGPEWLCWGRRQAIRLQLSRDIGLEI